MKYAEYEGNTYQVESGQWSWVIYENGEDIAKGAGYETEDESEQALSVELTELLLRGNNKKSKKN
jgi:uncharacterized protein YegP (UPF0339 family)